MSLLSSVPSTPYETPQERGRPGVRIPPNGRSQSEDIFATPRATRMVQPPACPAEGRGPFAQEPIVFVPASCILDYRARSYDR